MCQGMFAHHVRNIYLLPTNTVNMMLKGFGFDDCTPIHIPNETVSQHGFTRSVDILDHMCQVLTATMPSQIPYYMRASHL